jgi:hypothetical protein
MSPCVDSITFGEWIFCKKGHFSVDRREIIGRNTDVNSGFFSIKWHPSFHATGLPLLQSIPCGNPATKVLTTTIASESSVLQLLAHS